MTDFGNAIKYLYREFILRDILSFVTPGAIIIVTASVLLIPEPTLKDSLERLFGYSRSMYWLLYIPLFGLFFMVGFAVQCFGEIFDIIRFTPNDQGCWRQRFNIFWCKWAKDSNNIWWGQAHERFATLHEAIKDDETAWHGRERLVVLKQMCGNGFLAILIAGLLILVHQCWPQVWLWFLLTVAFLLLVSLFWGFRVHVLRQYTREETILSLHQNKTKKS